MTYSRENLQPNMYNIIQKQLNMLVYFRQATKFKKLKIKVDSNASSWYEFDSEFKWRKFLVDCLSIIKHWIPSYARSDFCTQSMAGSDFWFSHPAHFSCHETNIINLWKTVVKDWIPSYARSDFCTRGMARSDLFDATIQPTFFA